MNCNIPYVGRQYSFNGVEEIPARDLFTPASEIEESSNYDARQLAQILACVAVEEADR